MCIFSNLFDGYYLPLIIGALIFNIQYRRSSTFRYYAKFTYFSLHSAFFATFFLPIMFFRPRNWKNALIPAAGLRLIKRLFGFKWKIKGHENIVQDSGAVVLINHQSIIDLIVLAELWPIMDHCTVISKKEIFYLGPFGLASYLWGTIFIDRLNPDKAKDTINKTGKIVQMRKAKLCMFPEGTRHGEDELLPFKKGAFHVAIASGVPIQPVVVSKYYYIDYKNKKFDSGYTQIEILPPIPTNKYTRENIDELIDKTYNVMSQKYKELNKQVFAKVETEKYDCNENKKFCSVRSDNSNPLTNLVKDVELLNDSQVTHRLTNSRAQIQQGL
ncbi:1-acyl-sn-glycerol-3-phosphate acyltransferase alpha, putative [Pediculus humanus corporis]|uniref:1-acyl-sn-glycerol-3-phosphate acyltransferase n=1 Tax=Pediculus humanus subsp. corporis TaxID=121224 RepID=E0VLP4_PEDHC|nr:1-acyl-sn-glycerol-3-phosphate acyltransferase alpha, putative [Pediculus humanus corporis]EEB14300.1 1-acyl-sn-glycerol-3-phosphate acyltransferase alpha, putative [Pediculus humanus corporis]